MNLEWKNAIVSGSVELNTIWIIIAQIYWNVFLGKYWEKSEVVLGFLRKIEVKWKPEVWDFVHSRCDKIRKWRSPIFILSRHVKSFKFFKLTFLISPWTVGLLKRGENFVMLITVSVILRQQG